MKRPSIQFPCHADTLSGAGESVAKVTFPDGTTCHVSASIRAGVRAVEIMDASAALTVRVDGEEIEMEGE